MDENERRLMKDTALYRLINQFHDIGLNNQHALHVHSNIVVALALLTLLYGKHAACLVFIQSLEERVQWSKVICVNMFNFMKEHIQYKLFLGNVSYDYHCII